jgi:SAM-dependent methyltransferase
MSDTNEPAVPEHVAENRSLWNRTADDWVASAERNWAAPEPSWGQWDVPERDLNMLPADMSGRNAIELGCGTAYVSAWMAKRGATVVGIDISERQLETARRLADQHGVDLKLLHGNAEAVPYGESSFDFAISEYGAAIWCDPHVWIPEAHRLLVPGGDLVFLGSSPLAMICTPMNGASCEPQLHRDYFDIHTFDWRKVEIDPGGMEFNLMISDWLRLFRDTGFDVLDYIELRAPDSATGLRFSIPAEWARRWPSEQVWKLRKRG